MRAPEPRRGMPAVKLDEEEFKRRYRSSFTDPVFKPLDEQVGQIADGAWDAYKDSRKSPHTRAAGPGFADPAYEIANDWFNARAAIEEARHRHDSASEPIRILIVNGSSRSEHTCPGEMSKSWRLAEIARDVVVQAGAEADLLDLSRTTSEYGKNIHPCKSCVSTSMALCHWPCTCYPNYSLGQTHDWMNEIYPMWVAAHGVLIVTPVNWYQVPGPLKAMIDRLVCADGGNTDPSSTHGKKAKEAKELELAGWPFTKHLEGRHFALVVHGDSVGADAVKNGLSNWLTDMALIPAGRLSTVEGYIGYMEPYATSHQALDEDDEIQEEVRNAARSLVAAVSLAHRGKLDRPDFGLSEPNPK